MSQQTQQQPGQQAPLSLVHLSERFRPVHEIKNANAQQINCIDVRPNQLIYVQDCSNSSISIPRTVTKVIIEKCKSCTLTVSTKFMSGTLEIINCEDLTVKILEEIPTITVDTTQRCAIEFDISKYDRRKPQFVWSKCSDLSAVIDNQQHIIPSCETLRPEQDANKAQFRSQFIPDDHQFLNELLIREGAGYATTEREKAESDERERRSLERLRDIMASDAARTSGR
eukprot:TRINITY_DN1406_c0_g1_i1.p1 TRINITY_DN1406_c0_g1~~TRINITY_DN1406_c0_g1_i1.p1  ORF type:complete len:251 (-),score=71.67 TRINITY_DN1406_c0_g1_i1:72-752(-)